MFAFEVYFRFLAVRESRFLLPDSPAGAPGVPCGAARKMGGARRGFKRGGAVLLAVEGVPSAQCVSQGVKTM